MLHVRTISVGKIKERGIADAVSDYEGRIARYARFDAVVFSDAPNAELLGKFQKAIPERAFTVALEVDGKRLSSQGLAQVVSRAESNAKDALVFLIGGAYGLPPEISAAAHLKLSLSDMTLPHRLARLFLAEQIYRAFTILRGEPYSH